MQQNKNQRLQNENKLWLKNQSSQNLGSVSRFDNESESEQPHHTEHNQIEFHNLEQNITQKQSSDPGNLWLDDTKQYLKNKYGDQDPDKIIQSNQKKQLNHYQSNKQQMQKQRDNIKYTQLFNSSKVIKNNSIHVSAIGQSKTREKEVSPKGYSNQQIGNKEMNYSQDNFEKYTEKQINNPEFNEFENQFADPNQIHKMEEQKDLSYESLIKTNPKLEQQQAHEKDFEPWKRETRGISPEKKSSFVQTIEKKYESENKKQRESGKFWYQEINIPLNEEYESYKEQFSDNEFKNKQQIKVRRKEDKKINELWSQLREQFNIDKKKDKNVLSTSQDPKQAKETKNLIKRDKKNKKADNGENKEAKVSSIKKIQLSPVKQVQTTDLSRKIKNWAKSNKQISLKRKKLIQQQQYKAWIEEKKRKQAQKQKIQEQKRERAKEVKNRLQKISQIKAKKQELSRVKIKIKQQQQQLEYFADIKQSSNKSIQIKRKRRASLQNDNLNVKHKIHRKKAYSDHNIKIKINQMQKGKNPKSQSVKLLKSKGYEVGHYKNYLEEKKSAELPNHDKDKLIRRKIFTDKVREIPVTVDQQKKKQILIGIDKSMNPLKYQLLSRKGLSDTQIYEHSKQFNVNVDAKEQKRLGNDYLIKIRELNKNNQLKLARPVEDSLKNNRYSRSLAANDNAIFLYEKDLQILQGKIKKEKEELSSIVTSGKKEKIRNIKHPSYEDLEYIESLGFDY